MKMSKTITAESRIQWREWLNLNGESEKEVWLVYYKAHSGKPTISYQESLEEALCFGWVDSIIQKIDEETYARKFNPRRPGSQWSEINKHLVAKLIEERRMTEKGLAKVEFEVAQAPSKRPVRKKLELPVWLEKALRTNLIAWKNFQALAPSQQRNYIGWISSAKREDTRRRRIKEAIALLDKNQKLGFK